MGELPPPQPRAASLDPRAEVDRILSAAFSDAERALVAAGAEAREAWRRRGSDLLRRRDALAESARRLDASTARAVEALAAAAECLATLARNERIVPPAWPPRPAGPVEVKLSEVREVSLRFARGGGGGRVA